MSYRVEIHALPPFGLLNLRAHEPAQVRLDSALGFALPRIANTTAGPDESLAFWLGPDEWLLRTADGAEIGLAARLRDAVAGTHAAVTVVSDAYTVFGIVGPEVGRILVQGTGIDVDPRVFPPGSCARTRFAKTRALLHAAGPDSTHHLYVPRSYGHYARRWLERARG